MRFRVLGRWKQPKQPMMELHAGVQAIPAAPFPVHCGDIASEIGGLPFYRAQGNCERLVLWYVIPIGARQQPSHAHITLQELVDAELNAPGSRPGNRDPLGRHVNHIAVAIHILERCIHTKFDGGRGRVRADRVLHQCSARCLGNVADERIGGRIHLFVVGLSDMHQRTGCAILNNTKDITRHGGRGQENDQCDEIAQKRRFRCVHSSRCI